MSADRNRIRSGPRKVAVHVADADEVAGTRTPFCFQREIPGLREEWKPAKKSAAPSKPLPKHLRILTAAPKPRPKSAAAAPTVSREPPPLAIALENAGLGHYVRKLCEDQSASTVEQLLALDRPAMDALIDSLRPLPGHRTRILQFLQDQRAQREGSASGVTRISAEQARNWKATAASLTALARRGKDGPIAHLTNEQPLHWGGGSSGGPPLTRGTASRVHVIKVAGGGRMTVFDGERPNAPSQRRS